MGTLCFLWDIFYSLNFLLHFHENCSQSTPYGFYVPSSPACNIITYKINNTFSWYWAVNQTRRRRHLSKKTRNASSSSFLFSSQLYLLSCSAASCTYCLVQQPAVLTVLFSSQLYLLSCSAASCTYCLVQQPAVLTVLLSSQLYLLSCS